MKILIIPDKFKGSLNSAEVCNAIERGISRFLPKAEISKIPLADGGEGSLKALQNVLNFEIIHLTVKNPLFQNVKTFYGMKNDVAFIELALASGLQLLEKNEQNPMFTSSFGTGEILLDALKKGAKKINLFVGGSASNDAAMGITSALGYVFLDENGKEISPIGKNLIKIKSIDATKKVKFENVEFSVLTDVENPLFGKSGAAFSFALQKGANQEEINILDAGLQNISQIIEKTFGVNISNITGSGSAGGVGGGMVAFCNAKIESGIEKIMNLLNVNAEIMQNDLVITGEGLLDLQTLNGKSVKGVADRCKKLEKPLCIICGENILSTEELETLNPVLIKTLITNNISLEDSMKNASKYLENSAADLIKEYVQKIKNDEF